MCQYHMPILGDADGVNRKVFDRSVDGEYTLAKLLEHSWWNNPFVNSFSVRLYNRKCRFCWVGDYANDPSDLKFVNCSAIVVPYYAKVWDENVSADKIPLDEFHARQQVYAQSRHETVCQLGRVQGGF